MQLFDANVQVGRFRQMTAGYPFRKQDLLADMDRFGIAEALVLDSLSRESHPSPGNARVLRLTTVEPRLHPCWALLPPRGGEIGPLETLLERMAAAGVRAVKLFPGHHTFSLREWCLGQILDVLEEGRIPTFVDFNKAFVSGWPPDDTDWEAVVQACAAHPDLPIIISESRFRAANRMIYEALEECPNLRLELSGFWVHRGIEFVCREFGAERLMFGTKWPLRELGCTTAMLRFAEITDDDRAKIAGDNLRGLLAAAHPQAPPPAPQYRVTVRPPPGRSLRARALRGEPPRGETIIDIHAHLGKSATYHIADAGPARVEREMTRLGVLCSVVFGFSGVTGDWTQDNNVVARAMRDHPGRYFGLIVVNPLHPDEMRRELDRCEGKGFIGVKLIPHYQGYPEDGPNIEIPVAWANERKMMVLNHGWGPVEHLRRLADAYPEVTFIVGHYTTAYALLVNTYPHVYQCTCEPLNHRSIETLVEAVDVSKVLFGSDVTDLPLAMGMGPILHARIPEADKRKILGLNALEMLRRMGVDPLACGK